MMGNIEDQEVPAGWPRPWPRVEQEEVGPGPPTPTKPLTLREELARKLRVSLEDFSERTMEALLTHGDVGMLPPPVRAAYISYRAEQLGLDPLSQPIDLISFGGRTILYTNRGAADQLGRKHRISIYKREVEYVRDLLVIWVWGRDPEGREGVNCGAVFIGALKGEALEKAYKVCMTQAMRRLNLAMTGCGTLDETELGFVKTEQRKGETNE